MKRSPVLFFLMLTLLACSQTGQVGEVNAQTFNELLARTPRKIILDVRTDSEVAQGIIPEAVHIDYNGPAFADQLSKLDKQVPLFVYCAVGGRSRVAGQALTQAGFKVIYTLSGGIQAWQQAGFPVVSKTP